MNKKLHIDASQTADLLSVLPCVFKFLPFSARISLLLTCCDMKVAIMQLLKIPALTISQKETIGKIVGSLTEYGAYSWLYDIKRKMRTRNGNLDLRSLVPDRDSSVYVKLGLGKVKIALAACGKWVKAKKRAFIVVDPCNRTLYEHIHSQMYNMPPLVTLHIRKNATPVKSLEGCIVLVMRNFLNHHKGVNAKLFRETPWDVGINMIPTLFGTLLKLVYTQEFMCYTFVSKNENVFVSLIDDEMQAPIPMFVIVNETPPAKYMLYMEGGPEVATECIKLCGSVDENMKKLINFNEEKNAVLNINKFDFNEVYPNTDVVVYQMRSVCDWKDIYEWAVLYKVSRCLNYPGAPFRKIKIIVRTAKKVRKE